MKLFLDAIQLIHILMQPLPDIYYLYFFIYRSFIISIFFIYCGFFLFYAVWKINIWIPTLKIYLVTFIIQKLNWVQNKITPSHWCFKNNSLSWKKWFEKFINNFICIIIWHKFYYVALQVHYTLFIIIFRRFRVNCNC